MTTKNHPFRIALVEDNEFEILLLQKNLRTFIQNEELHLKRDIVIEKFNTFEQFVTDFNVDTHLVFSDLQLENKHTGFDVLSYVKILRSECKVVMLSSQINEWKLYLSLLEGANGIILKNELRYELCNFLVYKYVNAS
ncbi:MAG: hypothetical protein V4638_11475 [Bacteroidota bacterium]